LPGVKINAILKRISHCGNLPESLNLHPLGEPIMPEFFETLSGHNGELLIPIVLSIVGGIVAVAAIVVTQWRKHRLAEMEYALKHEMLQRGMSAQEIERVLSAGQAPTAKHCPGDAVGSK
jgi:hypothetical protein